MEPVENIIGRMKNGLNGIRNAPANKGAVANVIGFVLRDLDTLVEALGNVSRRMLQLEGLNKQAAIRLGEGISIVEQLSVENAALKERCASMECDRDSWRLRASAYDAELRQNIDAVDALAGAKQKLIETTASKLRAAEELITTQAKTIETMKRGDCPNCGYFCGKPRDEQALGLDIDKAGEMAMRTDREGLPPKDQVEVDDMLTCINELRPITSVKSGPVIAELTQRIRGFAERKHNELRETYVAHGLGGEVGEVIDMVKKHVYHGKPLDPEKMKEELGDVFWGWARACKQFNLKPSDVVRGMDAKLRKRYPNGFNESDANARRDEVKS